MTTETLYKPKGAGHNAPDRNRRGYNKPGQKMHKSIFEAFERWLNRVEVEPDQRFTRYADKLLYDATRGGICYWSPNHLELPSEEINALVMHFDDHPSIRDAGIFVTAMYNGLRNSDFVFDASTTPINLVGWQLQPGNRITIRCDTGEGTGKASEGVIINHGECMNLGEVAKGHIINHGKAHSFGETYYKAERRPGFLLNYGEARTMGFNGGNVMVNYGKAKTLSHFGLSQAFNFGEAETIGEDSYGPLVNFGKCRLIGHRGCNLGFDVSVVINDGECEHITSSYPGPEIVLAARDPKNPRSIKARGIKLREGDCREIPEIREYLEGLRDMLGPHKHYNEVLSHLYGLDVEADVRRILTEAGRLEG